MIGIMIDTKKLTIISIVIHFFVGIGAMAGGMGAILSPEAPMGMPVDAMRLGPFTNYLIPGIVLFSLIGLGNVISGFWSIKRGKFYEYGTGMMGAFLIGWLVIQCIILLSIHYLHVIFFVIGSIQGIIALVLLKKKNMFPWTIVNRCRILK